LAFFASFVLHAEFPLIVLIAASLGILGGRFAPDKFAMGGGHSSTKKSFGPALIDDDSPIPEHAKFCWSQLFKIIAVGLFLWTSVMSYLTIHFGWNGALTQMGWFFTKAALLTFGGAYAVLPYVYQGAVEHYHWLTAPQMIDGLALGETTPGPLIMIVTFVGFLAGWGQLPIETATHLMCGIAGALVVTYFTFLPSFLFILAGGPLVESTRNNLKFTAPLTAITAAIVGVIVNLAVFFAWHVFWPQGDISSFDLIAALIGIGAMLALFRYKIGIIPVIVACGSIGFLLVFIKPWLVQQGLV